jgi:periplasmic divalent cation tolerance protein
MTGGGDLMDRVDDDICELVITGPNADWLAEFTRQLVDDRLAACGQLIPGIRSIYWWQGSVQDDPEARVALHTRRSLVPAILERAERDHPYDVPCVIALPVTAASPGYARWVLDETSGGE